ncbi:hypothetical protein SteCoe_9422 [Stentor coeruleus]|uniref:Phosphodiesterase n=1 Tax=Stentor coeruleus TaxID=5963 RepID=A0A1R2CI01_9CILI|nr:hypothetical protein SteCoe_9422 [Stentor coeruleus]
MKVVPYPTSVIVENQNLKINYWTLKFLNRKIESSYVKYMNSRPKAYCEKQKKLLIQIFHSLILLIYTANYLSYIYANSISKSIIFQLTLIIFALIVTQVLFYLGFYYSRIEYKIKSKEQMQNPNKTSLYSLVSYKNSYYISFSYFCASIVLILNCPTAQNLIFSDLNDSALSCLPGLISLSFLYSSATFNSYNLLVLYNIVLLLLFGFLNLYQKNSISTSILEILLLFIIYIIHIILAYIYDLECLQEYISCKLSEETEPKQLLDNEENASNNYKVNDCIEELNNVLPTVQDHLKFPIERAVGLLTNISNDGMGRYSGEKSILDQISSNLDEEDKIYIEQSWSNNQCINVRKREKIQLKKSLENNLDKYFQLDIVLIVKQVSINWNFDSFDLNFKTGLKPLSTIGKYCFKLYNITDAFSLVESKIDKFLSKLEKSYKSNPYHNAVHAADILASALYIINNSFLSSCLSDLDMLSVIISHLSHDVGHPGFTNRFLVNFQDRLALQCNLHIDNDISVLENMHCSIAFSILAEEDKNVLEPLDNDQFLLVRKMVIDMILATDMGKHFDLLGIFRFKNHNSKSLENFEIKLEVLRMLIKVSDIGHAAKSNDIHINWSLLITEEFFRQGDIEKESKKPVSMYCDRETTIIAKSQIGFLRNIALPLYEAMNHCLASSKIENECIDQIKNNISAWEYRFKNDASRTLRDIQPTGLLSESPSTISLQGIKSHSDAILSKHK